MKIGALNCQGLKDKIDFPEVQKIFSSCDIFGVTETWLGDNDIDQCYLEGYKFYPLNRKKQKGAQRGGIGLFIKNEWKEHIKMRYDISCENFLWCKMSKNFFGFHDELYVGIVYFPQKTQQEKRKSI